MDREPAAGICEVADQQSLKSACGELALRLDVQPILACLHMSHSAFSADGWSNIKTQPSPSEEAPTSCNACDMVHTSAFVMALFAMP